MSPYFTNLAGGAFFRCPLVDSAASAKNVSGRDCDSGIDSLRAGEQAFRGPVLIGEKHLVCLVRTEAPRYFEGHE